MSSRSNTEVIAVLRRSKAGCAPRAALISVETYQGPGKLDAGHGRRQGAPENLGHLVDFASGDHQRWQKTHHTAMAPAQFQDQPALEAFALHQRRQLAMHRWVALTIRRASRVYQLHPQHQPTPTDIPQMREVALQDAQVFAQALTHGRRMARQVVIP